MARNDFDLKIRIARTSTCEDGVSTTAGDARWLGLIGVVPLTTAAFRFCPLYRLVGLSTCPLVAKK